ncbi:Uncharacterized protein OS=Pelobacter carbinolicus (strain DSM 2380 / Gra Bd 1) GN=Pcar_1474 PE=4 SV=1 [Gemmataceae bacterium]|nr:Uncharacterized protein OS=Pelobacter carbinolicus (strain DSM 2380 / Gra Bd 1) GN=Pcar_1474 PE=4 SV=1 [Gemmataceae bacterium]VTT97572.1 Uncharacterized protein OS=Pelobacter carbinolicus (strain DSM 2380 / Gra Bd 1) GN=Pcar_1474 PE=4 SV=1 [Gemmataceae bacterium]
MILRLPLKLNARIGGGTVGAMAPHANPLLDWSVRAFEAGRNEYVLLSNTRSLYSAVLDGVANENAARFAERVVGLIRAILEGAGHGTLVGHRDEPAIGWVQFAKALDRSVTGSMNELVAYAEMLLAGGDLSVPEVGVRLNDLLLSALAGGADKYGTPRGAFAALVAGESV